MSRILILLALLVVTVYLVRKIYLSSPEKSQVRQNKNPPPGLMKKCQLCDLHLPTEQGVTDSEGHFFCSTEHKDQFNN